MDFIDSSVILNDASLVFNPSEPNDLDHVLPLDEIDPAVNFYNNIQCHIQSKCTYFNELSFKLEVKAHQEVESRMMFSLCHLNIRSMQQNFDNFSNYSKHLNFTFPIIGLMETWLSESTSGLFGIAGYGFVERHWDGRSGGGVGVFIRNTLNFEYRDDISHFDGFCECLCIEMEKNSFDMTKNILVAITYRPPNTDSGVFIDVLNNFLENVKWKLNIVI